MTAAATIESNLFPLRRRTGTAAFHMSKGSAGFGLEDLEKLTPVEAIKLFAKMIWGSSKTMPCPHCGTIDAHYWSVKEMRWKCAGCGKRFSVTSGTVLADRKLPLATILKLIFLWTNGTSGVPALQLRRSFNVSYPTIFSLLHKLREGLVRGHNTGIMCGVVEMDGMDVNGRRYREKRNKPRGASSKGKPSIPGFLLRQDEDDEEIAGPPLPPKFGKAERQNKERRIMLSMRQRGVSLGMGAAVTRIGIAITESAKTVTALATSYASSESMMMSDEDPSYANFENIFRRHSTVNHSKAFTSPGGVDNNQAESFNWRARRAVEGIYLSISNKYLVDYASEQAWREDTRRMGPAEKLAHLFRVALSVGLSHWWRGYTHGHHRKDELLVEGPQPAPARGKKVGAVPRALR